jgi:hypothetical protein
LGKKAILDLGLSNSRWVDCETEPRTSKGKRGLHVYVLYEKMLKLDPGKILNEMTERHLMLMDESC